MSSSEINLHQATTSDIDMIVDFQILFSNELIGKQDPAIERSLRSNLQEYYNTELNNNCLCWYASTGAQPVAMISIVLRRQPGNLKNPSGRWGYIMGVFTLPTFRRLGISSKLLDKITAHAVSLGVTAFELHSTKDGERTYQKNGFGLYPEPTYRKYV